MLFVISDTVFRKDEPALINALFDAGMERFHVRKPSATASEIQSLLEQIKPEHLGKVALHHHHSLAHRLGITRLHYTEERRKGTEATAWAGLRESGLYLSTSIHHPEHVPATDGQFDALFFGPVFNSISKPGYRAAIPEDFIVPQVRSKMIAIGGIEEKNIAKARQMGFDGVALLGTLWQSSDPVKSFQQIVKAWI